MSTSNLMKRRLWLMSPLAALAKAGTSPPAIFHHDHILGTSFELQMDGPGGEAATTAALNEVERLRRILSTYDESSAISIWRRRGETGSVPEELSALLLLYDQWGQQSGGAITSLPGGRRDINALGKSFIVERALDAAHQAAPEARGMLLNIGGDIAIRGASWRIDVADPNRWYDNARAMTQLELNSDAVATSGGYERGAAHLTDPRTGRPATGALSATVTAPDAVTANALSTALCILDTTEGKRLIESTQGAEALVVDRDGKRWRSSGLSKFERPLPLRRVAASGWPKDRQLTITLTLRQIEGYRVRRPYVAVWAEDMSGKLVKNITVWTERRRWLPDLFDWWKKSGNAGGGTSVTRATRPAGRYQLVWDGSGEDGQPVEMGKYRIVVETNREHGSYAKESAVIECGASPAKAVTRETGEFEAVELNYGPGGQSA